MNNVSSLKARQLNAIQLLAVGVPAYKVAAKLEVSTMTIYRWQKLPAFEEKLNAIATSGLEEIAKKMNATTLTAVETLQEILCDMTLPTPIRMKAALGVLGSVASVNNMLEKTQRYGAADFDLQQRFSERAFTFDANGNRFPAAEFSPSDSEEVEV
jgi:hypothetical protein